MAPPRGEIRGLTFTTQRIDKAVSGLNGGCFTPKVISEMSGINKQTVNMILCEKTKKGLLQRVERGCYKGIPGRNLAIRRPSAFVVTKVWKVLSQSEKPLTNREISEIIEEDAGLNLYFQVGVLLFIWYRRKVLDKIGGKKPYEYQIKADYKNKDRPVASHYC